MRPVLSEQEVARFRSDVCRVAEVLFARYGVEGVTMRQIASELGWSPTTAYRYFQNKEEILSAVRAAAFNRFSEVIESAARSTPDARKNARKVGESYLAFALRHPNDYRMMFDVKQAAMATSAELAEALERAHRCMAAYVEPLVDQGVLRGDAKSLGHMMWAATHGLVMLRLSGMVASDAELQRLHEKTMSALVRGHNQTAPAGQKKQRLSLVASRKPRQARRARST